MSRRCVVVPDRPLPLGVGKGGFRLLYGKDSFFEGQLFFLVLDQLGVVIIDDALEVVEHLLLELLLFFQLFVLFLDGFEPFFFRLAEFFFRLGNIVVDVLLDIPPLGTQGKDIFFQCLDLGFVLRLVLFCNFLRFEDFELCPEIFRFVVERRLNDLALGVDLVQAFPAGLQEAQFRLFQTDDGFQPLQFSVLRTLRGAGHRRITAASGAGTRAVGCSAPQIGYTRVPFIPLCFYRPGIGAGCHSSVLEHPSHHREYGAPRFRHVPCCFRRPFRFIDGVGEIDLLHSVNQV